jgi:hypothetical protein
LRLFYFRPLSWTDGMFEPRDSDQDLADDIGFGLWRHGRLEVPIEARRLIGRCAFAARRLATST